MLCPLRGDGPYDSAALAYLCAFLQDLGAALSGIASAPFTWYSLHSTTEQAAHAWGLLAIFAFVIASYRVWRNEHMLKEKLTNIISLSFEGVSGQTPDLANPALDWMGWIFTTHNLKIVNRSQTQRLSISLSLRVYLQNYSEEFWLCEGAPREIAFQHNPNLQDRMVLPINIDPQTTVTGRAVFWTGPAMSSEQREMFRDGTYLSGPMCKVDLIATDLIRDESVVIVPLYDPRGKAEPKPNLLAILSQRILPLKPSSPPP